ncbi:MAG: hypothetical protein HYY06_15310 [Deltaproteobacteria bacterium]|nr:hypothetical protein [Deltaproteobacteria bacterium]
MRTRSWARLRAVLAGAVASWTLMLPPAAEAQSRRAVQRARIFFSKGVRQYDRGQFQPALRSFTRAYQLAPAPAVVYNIAQCHLSLGHDSDAARHFRLYLQELPDAPNRREVERRLREIDARVAAQRRDQRLRAMADVRDEQERLERREVVDDELASSSGAPRSGGVGAATWIVLGAGVATAGIGGLFAWDAAVKQSDLDEPSLDCSRSIQRCLDLVESGDRSATLRTILLGAGGAILTTGIVMLVVDLSSSDDDAPEAVLAPRLGPGLAMIEVRASW